MKWDRKTRGGDGTAEEFLRANWMRLTDEEVANQLSKIVRGHVTTSAVRQKRQALGLKKTRGGVPEIFKRSTYPRHNKPKTIRANDALVISDIHAPYHDARWADRVIYLARRWKIKQVLIAGDLFDFESLSRWTPAILSDDYPATDLDDEMLAAHGHDWGETTRVSGRYAAACGMVADPARLAYSVLEDNTRPKMQQGAWFLRGGSPILVHPRWRPPEGLG